MLATYAPKPPTCPRHPALAAKPGWAITGVVVDIYPVGRSIVHQALVKFHNPGIDYGHASMLAQINSGPHFSPAIDLEEFDVVVCRWMPVGLNTVDWAPVAVIGQATEQGHIRPHPSDQAALRGMIESLNSSQL